MGKPRGLRGPDRLEFVAPATLVRDGLDPSVGAQTVLIAVVVNTAAKAVLAWFIAGAGWYRRVVAGGLLPAAVIGLVLWLVAWPGDYPR